MPREIFGVVTDPSARGTTRRWSTVLMSFTAHAVVLVLLLVIPLMASGALPVPKTGPMMMAIEPAPPPAPPAPRRDRPTAVVRRDVPPAFAPDHIAPEPELELADDVSSRDSSGVVDGLSID